MSNGVSAVPLPTMVIEKLGFDCVTVSKKPRTGGVTGYEKMGPWRDKPGQDLFAQRLDRGEADTLHDEGQAAYVSEVNEPFASDCHHGFLDG
jgi:hypothetical protein